MSAGMSGERLVLNYGFRGARRSVRTPITMLKFILPLLLCAALSPAQDRNAPDADKASKASGNAQPNTQSIPDSEVVARAGSKEYTAGEIRAMIARYPPEMRRSFAQNPSRALNYILMLKSLAAQAQAGGLDKKPDFVNNAEFGRMNALAQAELARFRDSYHPSAEEVRKVYDEHPERWVEARFKAIYVAFSNSAPPAGAAKDAEAAAREAAMRAAGAARSSKQRSEADAKARAENIYQQLIAGADFEKLAREFSDDKTSAAKGGDFGTAGRLSPYPEEMKKALFGLKPGGISAPLRQPSGYYILKAESLSKQPLSDVKAIIEKELSTNHFNDWIKSIEARYTVDVVDDQYFAGRPPR
jgi:hypothetical protein